jgi:hypothetical protein
LWLALARERSWLSLYAAALALDGRAVLIAGESGSGKTTLALELAAHGARIYDDEVALVRRADGRACGLGRSLMIRESALALAPAAVASWCAATPCALDLPGDGRVWLGLEPAEAFGGGAPPEPLPLGGVFIVDGGPRALRPATPLETAVRLFRRANVAERNLAAVAELGMMLAGVRCFRIGRGTPGRMRELVAEGLR